MASRILAMSQKKKVELLFTAHCTLSLVSGVVAFLFPHAFEWFMIHHGEKLAFRDNADDEQKITHLVTRMYGALILAQAWITWSARACDEPFLRRQIVRAYFGVFVLTTLALLRAQLTSGGGLNAWNWLNILMFTLFSAAYGWFSYFEPIAVFQGLGKASA